MSDKAKDTIYIDVEEEITGIISKVQNSSKDIVALVLPKRASVLQSVVNMKLLKRSAEQAGKKVVLITSESKILPLAGAVGVFVASNLTSKPYVPPSPMSGESPAPVSDSEDVSIDPETPVSELAPDAKFANGDAEGIEIDNTKPKVPADGKSAKKSGGKLKVPSFSKFRKRLLLGGVALVALIAFLVWAIAFAPNAQVTVRANTKDLPLNIELRADKTEGAQADPANKEVRATTSELVKEDSETIEATGEKNNGKKADGSVSMTSTKCAPDLDQPSNVPAGTTLSFNGVAYTTKSATSFSSSPSSASGSCATYDANNSTSITAQSPGENANTSNSNFSVSGRSDVDAEGSASGGTDKIVKIVSDIDVRKAKERINSKQNTAQDEIEQQLTQSGFTAVEDSFDAGNTKYNVTPSVGSESKEVTVKSTTTYKMLGVNTDDIKKVIEEEVKNQEDGPSQSILSDGLNSANFRILSESGESAVVTVETTVVVGPDVDEEAIKAQIAGKKDGEAEEILNGISGFSDAQVDIGPFWVTSIPEASKVEFIVQQADGQSIPE
ncbi:MAG TPA: hypothetical protein VFX79_01700 [Candidatus Saccharimonadales bacterium]|nr:hypothetical protein [Candidatus Saccharimonadales bacterium]